jgi:general secretion pathway protein A
LPIVFGEAGHEAVKYGMIICRRGIGRSPAGTVRFSMRLAPVRRAKRGRVRMYRNYFGIDENPFSVTPDPRYLYMSEKHQEALAHLLYGVGEGGGFVLLTGEVGTGKTTICRCLLEQLPDQVDVALCVNPRMSEVELLATVCDDLGIHYPGQTASLKTLVDALNQHLIEAHAKGRRSVLIIDEAQNLSPGVLEQVRLLTNLETDKHKLLQIILIGQPELNDLLARRELRQLAQRITARYHLGSLTQRETAGFIRHRLSIAGLDIDLFDAGALAKVYKLSRGIPRLINNICDRCLLGAFARNRRRIDRRMVRVAAAEVKGRLKGKRATGRRLLPWASATAFAATAVALFVTLGPFELDRISLFAPSQAVVTASGPATAVPETLPTELQAASPVHELDTKEVENETAPTEAIPAVSSAAGIIPVDTPEEEQPPEKILAAKTEKLSAEAPSNPPNPASALEAAKSEGDTTTVTMPLDVSKVPPPQTAAPPVLQTLVMAPVDVAAEPLQIKMGQPETGKAPIEPETIMASIDPAATEKMPTPETLGDLFRRSAMFGDLEDALTTLFARWKLDYLKLKGFAPCSKAGEAGLQCLQSKGDWQSLQRLNRPALVTLTLDDGTRFHAVVSAFHGASITLQFGRHEIVTDTARLTTYWSGGYLALWKPPNSYRRQLKQGMKGPDVAWLETRLSEIEGGAKNSGGTITFDAKLKDRVTSFQREQGLKADGIVARRRRSRSSASRVPRREGSTDVMSVILDALRKSQQERDERGPKLTLVPHAESGIVSQPRVWPWALGAMLAVNAAVLAGLFWYFQPTPEQIVPVAEAPPSESPPKPGPADALTRGSEAQSPAPVAAPTSLPKSDTTDIGIKTSVEETPVKEASVKETPVKQSPIVAPRMPQPAAAPAGPPVPVTAPVPRVAAPVEQPAPAAAIPVPDAKAAAPVDLATQTAPAEPEKKPAPVAAPPAPRKAADRVATPPADRIAKAERLAETTLPPVIETVEVPVERRPLPMPRTPLSRPIRPAPTVAAPVPTTKPGRHAATPEPAASAIEKPTPTAKVASVPIPPPDPYEYLPTLRDLPSAFRKSVPRLTISVHVYTVDPKRRLVVIDGDRHREGAELAPGLMLDAITPRGMVLSYKGKQFQLGRQ